MSERNRFNLVDEPWITVQGGERLSLHRIFSEPELQAVEGHPLQKMAVTKLLLAIAQAAHTPQDDASWRALGADGLAEACLSYLDRHRDDFWLYGERPFLQSVALSSGQHVPGTEFMSDAERALSLLVFSARCPGALHGFLQAGSLRRSLWMNLLTHDHIETLKSLPDGLGDEPWTASASSGTHDAPVLKQPAGLMNALLPSAGSCLLDQQGLYILKQDESANPAGCVDDPTVMADRTAQRLCITSEAYPWRRLADLLDFLGQHARACDCPQLRLVLKRAQSQVATVTVWLVGDSGKTDAERLSVESVDPAEFLLFLESDALGADWHLNYQQEIHALENLAEALQLAVRSVSGDHPAAQSQQVFWRLAERDAQALVDACDPQVPEQRLFMLRKRFAALAISTFDNFCAAAEEGWQKHRPDVSGYLADATVVQTAFAGGSGKNARVSDRAS